MSKNRTERDILEDLKKRFPRIGFEGLLYYEICTEACTLVEQMRAEVKKLRDSQPKNGKLYRLGPKDLDLLDKIRKQESVAIAFAAMCLEACIWDYAACGTSKNKMEESFGSLNLVAKWVVIPQLLCGLDITKKRIDDTCLLGRLRKLKVARNDLVHPKSQPLPDNLTDAFKALKPKRRKTEAKDAFGLIGLLLGELEKVDKINWWFFQTPQYRNSIKNVHASSSS